jgi:hypothetical protein
MYPVYLLFLIFYSLGGRVVTTFKDCSVLVTDRVRRTLKFLCCVGLGTPIVGVEWLTTCRTSRKFVGNKFNVGNAHSVISC